MNSKAYKKAVASFMMMLALGITGIGGMVFSPPAMAYMREVVTQVIQGKVVAIETNVFHRGIIEVKNNHNGEVFKFYVGNRTAYYPHRYPYLGERVTVHYFNDRGYLKATEVEIR